MKTLNLRYVLRIVGVCVGISCQHLASCSADEEYLKLILLDSHPNIPQDIYSHARNHDMAITNVVRFYETLVESLLTNGVTNETNNILLSQGCYALGQLGFFSSTGLLYKVIQSKDDRCDFDALHAYIEICREDSLPLAEEMVATMDRANGSRRHTLYSAMTSYIGTSSNEVVEAKRGEMRRWLVRTIDKEVEADCAMKLDAMLVSTVPSYKRSVQRFKVMERFKKSSIPVIVKYFAGIAVEMDKVPIGERKDLLATEDMKEFRSPSGADTGTAPERRQ